MTILYSGNVGIGNTAPTEKLEVNGAIKIGDAATTGDGTIKYASGDFLGRKAGSWVSLTAAGGGVPAGPGGEEMPPDMGPAGAPGGEAPPPEPVPTPGGETSALPA